MFVDFRTDFVENAGVLPDGAPFGDVLLTLEVIHLQVPVFFFGLRGAEEFATGFSVLGFSA